MADRSKGEEEGGWRPCVGRDILRGRQSQLANRPRPGVFSQPRGSWLSTSH